MKIWLDHALAQLSLYEDINQEFPTSIFFDGDRDMSNNGLPATWPGGGTNRCPKILPMNFDNIDFPQPK
ncbi:MAG: hypothetical protein QW620_03020 [Thermoplasmata archaeon]